VISLLLAAFIASAAGRGTVTGAVVNGPDKMIRAQIKAVIDLRIVELRMCYLEARQRNKNLKGFMYFKWNIAWTGVPAGLKFEENNSTVKDAKLIDCMMKAIETWKFEPIQGEEADVTIQARFTLKP
jgi:hypothetical protein